MEHAQQISDEARPYLAPACKHFDTPPGAVVKARVEGTELVLLWDRGVNGIAKGRVVLNVLSKARGKAPKPKAPALEK